MEIEISGNKIIIDETLIEESQEKIQKQLKEYLDAERKDFDLEINFPDGLTGDVMREMRQILYGETRSYGELAQTLDTAAVAVGNACGKNPLPVIVPCHRVVGANSLGGYKYGRNVKEELLDLETENSDNL